MNRRVILLISLLVVAVGAFIGYCMYNEQTPQAAERSADVTIDAETLLQAFITDETAANKQYNDKVVQVSGAVRDVTNDGNGPTNVLLETSDPMASVVCEFPAGTKVS